MPAPTRPRLGADDWVRAALDVMVEDGIAGVKVQRLCDRLGVTKGSFYWHFADLDAFLGEVARRVGRGRRAAAGPARRRRRRSRAPSCCYAMRLFADRRNRDLARAMRDWAQNDERARAAIRKADEALFEQLKRGHASAGASTTTRPRCGPRSSTTRGSGTPTSARSAPQASAEQQLRPTWEILTQP